MGGFGDLKWYDMMLPTPNNLKDCKAEIWRLRRALIEANGKRAKAFEKYNLDKQALRGQIAAAKKELAEVKAEWIDLTKYLGG